MSDADEDEEIQQVVTMLQEKIRSMEEEMEKKIALMGKLKDHFNRVEGQIDAYRTENQQLKEELRQLKKQHHAAGTSAGTENQQKKPTDSMMDFDADDVEDWKDRDVSSKLQSFLKLFQSNELNRAQLNLHAVNALVSLYHILFSNDLLEDTTKFVSDTSEAAAEVQSSSISELQQRSKRIAVSSSVKIAFNYLLEFIRQIYEKKLREEGIGSGGYEGSMGYPINWLLSVFPYMAEIENVEGVMQQGIEASGDNLWMPLHFALAVSPSEMHRQNHIQRAQSMEEEGTSEEDYSEYINHIRMLLKEFGTVAFEEDVSPLCVAVANCSPCLGVIREILLYRPDSISTEDEDGSIPFMHACACVGDDANALHVLDYLVECYPRSVKTVDNFGCAPIHYAAFSGSLQTVRFLLDKEPQCATCVEGNGALPLHDAVQNRRCIMKSNVSTEIGTDESNSGDMVKLLLKAHPSAVRCRDDYGAFPLHKAAQAANLTVFRIIHEAFPNAVFAADNEGLLPSHYYSQRHDKDEHLGLLQYILRFNPKSKVIADSAELFSGGISGSDARGGGIWRSAMRLWSGSSASKNTDPDQIPCASRPPPTASSDLDLTAEENEAIQKVVAVLGEANMNPAVAGNHRSSRRASLKASQGANAIRRKTVRPIRGSIHMQYK